MQRKFAFNLAFLVLLNLLVKPFFILGIDAEVQNVVGANNYGNYFALLNLSFMFNMLLDLGITQHNTRNIARYPELFSKHFAGLFSIKVLLIIFYVAVTLIAAIALGMTSDQLWILGVLAINQFLVSMVMYFRSYLAGMHLFRQDSIISILDRFLLIIICSLLLWGNVTDRPFRIEWFVYAQTASYGLSFLIAFGILLRRTDAFVPRLNIPFTRAILKKSLPYALLIFLMTAYVRVDGVMLERLNGKVDAGIYAMGFRLLDAANMFAMLFAVILLPMFSRALKEGKSVEGLASLSFKIIFTTSAFVAFAALAWPEKILGLRYHEYIHEAAQPFVLLMFTFVGVATTYVFGTLLTAKGDLNMLNRLALVGLAANVGLNAYLIPKHGPYGAAIATCFTQVGVAIIQVVHSVVTLRFHFNRRLIFACFVYVVVLSLGTALLPYYLDNWFAGLSILFVSAMIVAFSFQLIPVRKMLELVRERQ